MTLVRWGLCPMFDGDGQCCILAAGHKGSHQTSGLRAWLEQTTDDSVMRTYTNPGANDMFQMEAGLLAKFGFYPVSQSGASMTAGPGVGAILALGILAFGRRTSSSSISVMFQRREHDSTPIALPSAPAIPEQIRELGGLRDAGLLTDEEFERKKAELLERM